MVGGTREVEIFNLGGAEDRSTVASQEWLMPRCGVTPVGETERKCHSSVR
jgi:hypothetical protein